MNNDRGLKVVSSKSLNEKRQNNGKLSSSLRFLALSIFNLVNTIPTFSGIGSICIYIAMKALPWCIDISS